MIIVVYSYYTVTENVFATFGRFSLKRQSIAAYDGCYSASTKLCTNMFQPFQTVYIFYLCLQLKLPSERRLSVDQNINYSKVY